MPDLGLCIQVGDVCKSLDKILISSGQTGWAFLTPCNPGSRVLTLQENEIRILSFIPEILKYRNWKGFGEDPEGKWAPESSFLVVGISLQDALDLAKRYGQFAFLYGRYQGPASLVWTGLL